MKTDIPPSLSLGYSSSTNAATAQNASTNSNPPAPPDCSVSGLDMSGSKANYAV